MRRRRSKWHDVQTFLYDPDEKTICTRTPINWLAVCSFYCGSVIIVCSIVVIAIFSLTYMVWHNERMHKNKEKLIEYHYPAISIVPRFGTENSPLIWFKKTNLSAGYKSADYYDTSMRRFLKPYEHAERNPTQYSDCKSSTKGGKPCLFKASDLGECKDLKYNNQRNDLCVLVKLLNVPRWTPRELTALDDLPDYTPRFIVEKLNDGSDEEKKQIWLDCRGSTTMDVDHLTSIAYYPQQGFASYYYPYQPRVKDYLRPIVAVKMSGIKPGVIVSVTCKIYNANVNYESVAKHSYSFAVYIEE